ncbi:hypothetical protein [Streptomyces sp. BK208]|uniref:hypothetical protein n=1 Tax=Streptomyces sp. BK208 TaxID=2512150 RepID=UPI001060027D|nr:hypothetical protein [Streptomyces sp. BK208]
MTVDDDPGVSRAVARDLRRRYGASYRIVRAESGESALETLRELKLRGDLVAPMIPKKLILDIPGIVAASEGRPAVLDNSVQNRLDF